MLGGKTCIAQSLYIGYYPKGSLFRCGFTKIFAGLKLLVYTNVALVLKKPISGADG